MKTPKKKTEWEKDREICGTLTTNGHRRWNCLITRPCIKHESQKEVQEYITHLSEKARKEERERIKKIIKMRLDYCRQQNGLPYCKNCGLCEKDLRP